MLIFVYRGSVDFPVIRDGSQNASAPRPLGGRYSQRPVFVVLPGI
ncbi:MAG: hypothetical protein ABSG75_02385 [Syntrophales bacterium]